MAHSQGGVPNVIVNVGGKGPRELGRLIYFFEYACGLSGYLLDVNPFDQPGVEAYKKNMFALLGKPGYEDRKGRTGRQADRKALRKAEYEKRNMQKNTAEYTLLCRVYKQILKLLFGIVFFSFFMVCYDYERSRLLRRRTMTGVIYYG